MKVKRVILSGQAYDAIIKQLSLVFLTETGGCVVGHFSDGEIFISDASGPGPRARLSPFSVTIDGQAATKFCAQAKMESGGLSYYVGDWHSHLSWRLNPSAMDLCAMQIAKEYTQLEIPPVSVLCSAWSKRFKAFLLMNDHLLECPMIIERHKN